MYQYRRGFVFFLYALKQIQWHVYVFACSYVFVCMCVLCACVRLWGVDSTFKSVVLEFILQFIIVGYFLFFFVFSFFLASFVPYTTQCNLEMMAHSCHSQLNFYSSFHCSIEIIHPFFFYYVNPFVEYSILENNINLGLKFICSILNCQS